MVFLIWIWLGMAPTNGPVLVETIRLDTAKYYEANSRHLKRATVLPNGSIALWNDFHTSIFNRQGKSIAEIGRRGQGPGEFQWLADVLYHDGMYWILDGNARTFSRFDRSGKFVKNVEVLGCFPFYQTDSGIYTMKWTTLMRKDAEKAAEVLHPIRLHNDRIELGESFHKFPEVSLRWSRNNKDQHVTAQGDEVYVVAELEPTLYVYDRETLALKRQHLAQIPFYEEPPRDFVNMKAPYEKRMLWWFSWTRILGVFSTDDYLIYSYGHPDSEDASNWVLVADRMSFKGKRLDKRPWPLQDGKVLGVYNNQIHVITQGDDPEFEGFYIYEVKVYQW